MFFDEVIKEFMLKMIAVDGTMILSQLQSLIVDKDVTMTKLNNGNGVEL